VSPRKLVHRGLQTNNGARSPSGAQKSRFLARKRTRKLSIRLLWKTQRRATRKISSINFQIVRTAQDFQTPRLQIKSTIDAV